MSHSMAAMIICEPKIVAPRKKLTNFMLASDSKLVKKNIKMVDKMTPSSKTGVRIGSRSLEKPSTAFPKKLPELKKLNMSSAVGLSNPPASWRYVGNQ